MSLPISEEALEEEDDIEDEPIELLLVVQVTKEETEEEEVEAEGEGGVLEGSETINLFGLMTRGICVAFCGVCEIITSLSWTWLN